METDNRPPLNARPAGAFRAGGWLLLAFILAGCGRFGAPEARTHAGLPALVQVDEGFYRGGQPDEQGLRNLQAMGVKTVISLRQPGRGANEERRIAESLGMKWVSYPMWYWWRPSDAQVQAFLSVATDPAQRPVYVHCRQGWNRTGIMTAIYRMAHDNWPPEQAYAEGRQHGLVGWNVFSRYLLFDRLPEELPQAGYSRAALASATRADPT